MPQPWMFQTQPKSAIGVQGGRCGGLFLGLAIKVVMKKVRFDEATPYKQRVHTSMKAQTLQQDI